MLLNEEETIKYKSSPSIQAFCQYVESIGVKMNGVEICCRFGAQGELGGCITNKDIEPNQVLTAVPIKRSFGLSKSRQMNGFQEAVARYPAVFDTSINFHGNLHQYIFCYYIERSKGQQSEHYHNLHTCNEFGWIWFEPEYSNLIVENITKQELIEFREQINELWEAVQKISQEQPELFPKNLEKPDFLLCCYLAMSRTFYSYDARMPSYFTLPVMELLNHDDRNNIFFDAIVKISLETSDQKICSELGYEKKSKFVDLSPLFSQIKEKPMPQKSRPVRFLQAAGHNLEDPFRISIQEETSLAELKTLELLSNIESLQVWNVPNWLSSFHEDEEEPQDIVDEEEGFEEKLAAFEELLRNPSSYVQPATKPQDFVLKRKGSAFRGVDRSGVENWFSEEEDDIYAVAYNVSERVIKAGEQVNLLYGKSTNRYLLMHYGFVLKNNVYDSVNFYYPTEEVRIQFGLEESVYFGYVSPFVGRSSEGLSLEQLGFEYRTKSTRINMELLVEIQSRLRKDEDSNESTHLNLPNSKSILQLELDSINEYERLFNTYLQKNLRPKSEYLSLMDNYKSDYKASSILSFEFGLLQIAEKQLRLSGLCRSVIDKCLQTEFLTQKKFKQIYFGICSQTDQPSSTRIAGHLIGISSFLHLLFTKLFITATGIDK